MGQPARTSQVHAWILPPRRGQTPGQVFGLTGEERLRRTLEQAGVASVGMGSWPGSSPLPGGVRVALFRADFVYDERLVRAVLGAQETLLVAPGGPGEDLRGVAAQAEVGRSAAVLRSLTEEEKPEALAAELGLRVATADDLVPPYTAQLRKSDPALLLPLCESSTTRVEQRLFEASYKGVTDLVTKWLWPAPALRVTRVLAAAGVSPNTITAASWLLVVLATVCFAQGAFGWGLAAAWLMTFLDTVDGKLARVTIRSTRIGHVLDHGLDLLHPPLWYLAFALALPAEPWLTAALWITLGGYLAGRLLEGLFLLLFRFEIHCWQPIDSRFRLVTARRNPNLVLLSAGTAIGRPELGFALVALWTAVSIAFHSLRLALAIAERRRGRGVRPWQGGEPGDSGLGAAVAAERFGSAA
jgi:phosphatidylglycerophosphate synthase